MNDLKKLAIVPALNEEGSIPQVIAEINEHGPGFDVLVIDDGSTDATAERAQAAGAIVIRHPFNLGIGGAVQSGYRYALRHRYDVAVQVDGDGQHDPGFIPRMMEELHTTGHADMVSGSRFREEAAGYRVPRSRRAGIRIFATVLSAIIGERITDPTSGFRMTNRRGIELFARDYPHDYPEVEAILMFHTHQMLLHEIPVRMRERGYGRSSITTQRSAYYMVRVLLAVLIGMFRRSPLPAPSEGLVGRLQPQPEEP
jgi:glycosyltransferase involved in cell wall biosynthesis